VKRDFDLIRSILLDIEETSVPSQPTDYIFDFPDRDAVAHSLELLVSQGLVSAKKYPTFDSHPADVYFAPALTWAGHDFLDSVRDDEIWRKTKEGVSAAGGFTFDLMKQLAKGLVKTQIEKHTGVKLDN